MPQNHILEIKNQSLQNQQETGNSYKSIKLKYLNVFMTTIHMKSKDTK